MVIAAEVFQVPVSDSAHRAWVPRQLVADSLTAPVMTIDSPNCKSSISNRDFRNAAMEVWRMMHQFSVGWMRN